MNSAYLYIRVSTDEQADKGYSQRSQDEVLHKYCQLKDIQVHQVIYEDHSAKNFNRPAWTNMLNGLKKQRNNIPDLILFTKWDRFSRNTADAYIMIGILRKLGIEPQAIEQPLDLGIPENKIMLAFYLAAPEVENDRRGLNIFYGIRRARKEGRWMGKAPVGYQNKSSESGQKYIRPNIPQANIMRQAFQAIASGRYSINQVWQQARNNGLQSQRNNFHILIRNPVYCGKILVPAFKDEESELVPGQHEALITEELFEKVQRILCSKKTIKGTKYSSTDQLPLRGFLACANCNRMLTGSASRGRNKEQYHYYHCNSKCGVRIKAKQINQDLISLLKALEMKKPFTVLFKEILKEVAKQQTKSQRRKRQQLLTELEKHQQRLEKIRELLLTEAISSEDYREIKSACESKIDNCRSQLNKMLDLDKQVTGITDQYKKLKPDMLFTRADSKEQRTLLHTICGAKLSYKQGHFQKPYLHPTTSIIFQFSKNPSEPLP